ncbi:hypothetical protein ACH5RR_002879 [Cinchona calisaya]|uniref:Uncharacterized protein n=1 Tax=Cinchona calisaya TaxID=153742 RepID=A0ABD3ATC3_9GENT
MLRSDNRQCSTMLAPETMDATSSILEKFVSNWSISIYDHACSKNNAIDFLIHEFLPKNMFRTHKGSFAKIVNQTALGIITYGLNFRDFLTHHLAILKFEMDQIKEKADQAVKSFKEKLKKENVTAFVDLKRQLKKQTMRCSNLKAHHAAELGKL